MQRVLILNLGGQYDQLVARRVRECRVFCEVLAASRVTVQTIRDMDPIGIILVGAGENPAKLNIPLFELGIPVLAIDQGCRLMIDALGGKLAQVESHEDHYRTLTHLGQCILFQDLLLDIITWMDHDEMITCLPDGFITTASTDQHPIAACCHPEKKLFGLRSG